RSVLRADVTSLPVRAVRPRSLGSVCAGRGVSANGQAPLSQQGRRTTFPPEFRGRACALGLTAYGVSPQTFYLPLPRPTSNRVPLEASRGRPLGGCYLLVATRFKGNPTAGKDLSHRAGSVPAAKPGRRTRARSPGGPRSARG